MFNTVQEFINACKQIDGFVDVTAEEPTDLMMAQITPAYTFSVKPTLFTFTFKDSTGVPRVIKIIVPQEIWSRGVPPVSEFRAVANRFAVVPQDHTFFLKPDTVDSIVLRGHSIVPVANPGPELTALLERLRTVDKVTAVQAYPVVDPAIIAEAGEEAIVIECSIAGLSNARYPDLGQRVDDVVQVILPKDIYTDVEKQDHVVQLVLEQITKLKG